jgi:hypothetical protein
MPVHRNAAQTRPATNDAASKKRRLALDSVNIPANAERWCIILWFICLRTSVL